MSSIQKLVQNLLENPESEPAIKAVSLRLSASDFAYASVLAGHLGQNTSRFLAMLLTHSIEDAAAEYMGVLTTQEDVDAFVAEVDVLTGKVESSQFSNQRKHGVV